MRRRGKNYVTTVGTRVSAILDAENGIVRTFGDGLYAGRFDLPLYAGGYNFGQRCARIDLDNGKTVWGCECWWAPCYMMRKRFPPASWKWDAVDVDDFRRKTYADI